MNGRRKSHHDLKCCVFKNNYSRLRDGFKSTYSIKGFLYSKGVINADIRDTNDVEKVLSAVETRLKFSEKTWDILIDGMSTEGPPLDVLSVDLCKDLDCEKEDSKRPHTEPHSPSMPSPPPVRNHSGPFTLIIGSTNHRFPYNNVPPHSLPINPQEKPNNKDSGCSSISSHNYPDNHFFPSSSDVSRNISSESETTDSSKLPDSSYPVQVMGTPSQSSSDELVTSLTNNSYNGYHSNETVELQKKITDLQIENTSLQYTKKQIVYQLEELEKEQQYLEHIRREDQILLEKKMKQISLDNETLEKKQEFIRHIEADNSKMKKEFKVVMSENSELIRKNDELSCRLRYAEHNTKVSAITIDRLKEAIISKDGLILELREEVTRLQEITQWYESSDDSNNTSEEKTLMKFRRNK